MVERHFTLDRTAWGSDQAASLEPEGMRKLVNGIRACERAMGNGQIELAPSEEQALGRLPVTNTL
jgi:N-acetylneuraminate synthase